MIIRIGLKQCILVNDAGICFGVVVMIGDKRSGCRGIDPEGVPGQDLEKRREVKSPVSDRKPKTVHDLRGSGVTDGNLIQRSDLAVSVDVVELDVPAAVFPKILA